MNILPQKKPEEWLTPAEYAERYRVHLLTVYRWVKQGRLIHKKLGRSIRIDVNAEVTS